jgi:hypothetical protein
VYVFFFHSCVVLLTNDIQQLKETYFIVDALKQVSGFKWDEENGADINSDTLPVSNAYIEVCALSILHYSLTIISTQRYPKAACFKTKGWPHYFSMQMMMPSSVRTRGANMFHPLQDNPENDEQEEDGKAEGER